MSTMQQKKTTTTGLTLKRALATAGLMLGLAWAAPAAAVQCGDTIGPNVNMTLSGTLVCDDTTGSLTIVGPAKVTFDGFVIVCNDFNYNGRVPTGLSVLGSGAQVQGSAQGGGAIAFCQTGVEVAGEGGHTVTQLSTSNIRGTSFFIPSAENILQRNQASVDSLGFYVTGQRNILRSNIADGRHDTGFYIAGSNTRLDRNVASYGHDQGFLLINSTGHKVTANTAMDNTQHGFLLFGVENCTLHKNQAFNNGAGISVTGRQHKLTRNEVRWNALDGIWMGASESMVSNNTALDNNQHASPYSFDLRDLSFSCGTNIWKKNAFATASQPCIQ